MDYRPLIPVLLSIAAFFGWGIGDFVGIKPFRANNPSAVTFYSAVGRLLIWSLFLPLFIGDLTKITLVPFLFNLLAGLGSGVGYYFFGKAYKYVNPALVNAISGGWGGSALIYSLVFFNEKVSTNQWVAIALVFTGLFLVSFDLSWLKEKKMFFNKGLVFAFLSFLSWGVCGAFLKIPSVSYGWYWTSVIMLLPYTFVLLFESNPLQIASPFKLKQFKWFLLMIVLGIVADLGYNSSFTFGGSIAIVGTIGGSYSVLATLLSYVFYKEAISSKQKLGILVSLIGIVLTAFFTFWG